MTAKRFGCTRCGKCCNRSPEMELSEASALSDVFVFRLMFRLCWLPRHFGDYPNDAPGPEGTSTVFYQKKRLLGAYAAHAFPIRIRRGGKAVDYTKYLVVSALTLDTSPGACSALAERRCGIYDRRPFSCRTVPFHYSRVAALAESDLEAFVATPDYECDTGSTANVILEAGEIADISIRQARADALALAEQDRPWKDAVVRRLKADPGKLSLPSVHEIEANAPFGATTTSMSVAWQIAAEAGLIGADRYRTLIEMQLNLIERELAAVTCPQDVRETLAGMRAEYRHRLKL